MKTDLLTCLTTSAELGVSRERQMSELEALLQEQALIQAAYDPRIQMLEDEIKRLEKLSG